MFTVPLTEGETRKIPRLYKYIYVTCIECHILIIAIIF